MDLYQFLRPAIDFKGMMSGFRHAGVSKIGVGSITCYRQIRRLRSCPAALNGGSETETNSETLASRICSSLQSSLSIFSGTHTSHRDNYLTGVSVEDCPRLGYIKSLHIHLVECSPALQKLQHQNLKCTEESSLEKKAISSLAGTPVHWHATLEEVPSGGMHLQKQQGQSYAPIEEMDESLHVATSGGYIGTGSLNSARSLAVSNTVSYLRIWALRYLSNHGVVGSYYIYYSWLNYINHPLCVLQSSHSEISSVCYETMRRSPFSLGVQQCVDPDHWDHCFHIVGLLLVIETLSTFLRALRLHLVEFQNKFYAHFSFILTGNEDD
ncbi:hypothetical protein YC2023_085753 [Brassica napus]